MRSASVERNWAGNHVFGGEVMRPETVDEAAAIVRNSSSVRAVGARHSFTAIADAEVIIDLSALDRPAVFDADARTVTVAGSATYADVVRCLVPHGAALRNLASLTHVTVAGAIATATHGSGARHGNLATAVSGLEILTATGEIVTVDRRTPDFDGMVVSLGALGLVTAVTLDVDFDYLVEQYVYDDLLLDHAVEQLDMIMHAAYSVSIFTTFAGVLHGQVGQVWIKRRCDGSDRSMAPGPTFLDAPVATMQHHPVPGRDPVGCTRQLGEPGLWSDRLPHFRPGFQPETGNEVQSEFFVDAADGRPAFDALRRNADEFGDRLMVSEVRAVAADELWMSPQYRRDSIAFHFTWFAGDNDAAIRAVEESLAPFASRPHWGKVFHADVFDVGGAYELRDDFVDLVRRFDPHGVFRNDWWRRNIEQ